MKIPESEAEAVEQFRPFVRRQVRRFAGRGVPIEDLMQVALFAVVRSFRLWSPEGGANMLTWIHRPVLNALIAAVREQSRRGGNSAGHRRRGGDRAVVRVRSLDAPIRFEEARGRGGFGGYYYDDVSLHDVVGTFTEPRDVVAIERLKKAMIYLLPRERTVIRLRFVEGLKLHEIGARMGFSRERARQIEADALRKLRERLTSVSKELTS